MPLYVSASSRLHALLWKLGEHPNHVTLLEAWSDVLGVPPERVQFDAFGLPVVARLVSDAADEAKRAAAEVGLPLREQLLAEWSKPVYAPGGNLAASVQQQRVAPEALDYLNAVAGVLGRTETHEALPDVEGLSDLLDQVRDLAASIEEATDIPDDVRQALLRRISQLRFVIENVRVGGPEGVEEAVELLLGSAVLRSSAVPMNTVKKILAVVAAAFTLFSAGPTVQASLEAWPKVVETLKPGSATSPDAAPEPIRSDASDDSTKEAEDASTSREP